MSPRSCAQAGWLLVLLLGFFRAPAQRHYAASSVLANGSWYKMAITAPGIYRIDLSFLSKLGLPSSGLSSSAIRLFGNGGAMLPESTAGQRPDDLQENAIWVEDGGDGVLNGSDYILFYAPGPHRWLTDSLQRNFSHQTNLYSDTAWYFLTVGGNGARIATLAASGIPNTTITAFDDHYYHELDSVNFLSSGKAWLGEEFSDIPGHSNSRHFRLSFPGAAGLPALLKYRVLARSIGTASRFNLTLNGSSLPALEVPPVANGNYDVFVRSAEASVPFVPADSICDITLQYSPGSYNSQGWLDWLEVFTRRALAFPGKDALFFRDWSSVGPGNRGLFQIDQAAPGMRVWDISDPLRPVAMTLQPNGSRAEFVNDCSRLHEYVAFSDQSLLQPLAMGPIPNQNLHQALPADLLLVTAPALLSQARRLADFHQQQGTPTVVVTTDQVYNEFSSGTADPTAIRDFAKMYFDRAGGDSTRRPRYLLLFGDASFDYKNRITGNTNLVPCYESSESFDPLATYTSDDYFGMLADGVDINGSAAPPLDMGVGRLPADNPAQAQAIVDKILGYHQPADFGPWQNEVTLVADDEDANLHLDDAEAVSQSLKTVVPLLNLDKIYLDAYRQQSTPAGSRYPDVNLAISNRMLSGNLIWNYSGHGGFRRLAEEDILDQDLINGFRNEGKLPLFITATCDFAPYDNPLNPSIGENLLLRPKTGAIALMTTTRLVFAYSNRVMNQNYVSIALRKKPDGSYPSFGDAMRWAKNYTYTYSGDIINNRKFTLLGDPALTLALPRKEVRVDSLNGIVLGAIPDTLKALSDYRISGRVTDPGGQLLSGFNGTVFAQVFDKPRTQYTLGNDPGSIPVGVPVQDALIYRGKASVVNGYFHLEFVVPRDIDYRFGNGRVSLFANSNSDDAGGWMGNIIVGGTGQGSGDREGPRIQAWLNDEKFVSGSISNEAPLLLLKLSDSSGINILGSGIGHDLQAMLDDDPSKVFVLNSYYESDLNNFRQGQVRFQLPALEEGMHSLRIKAWDAANNSSEIILDFRVLKSQQFRLDHVLNYPNPFTTHTSFWFEHNRPGEELNVSVRIFTITGKLVKTLRSTIISTGNRSNEVNWDGRDDFGNRLARGVYVYQLRVSCTDGQSASQWQKLYIL